MHKDYPQIVHNRHGNVDNFWGLSTFLTIHTGSFKVIHSPQSGNAGVGYGTPADCTVFGRARYGRFSCCRLFPHSSFGVGRLNAAGFVRVHFTISLCCFFNINIGKGADGWTGLPAVPQAGFICRFFKIAGISRGEMKSHVDVLNGR